MENDSRLLTPAQRKVVGIALGYVAVLVIIALTILSFTVLMKGVSYFSGVIWPLVIAGIAALVLKPVVYGLEKHLKFSRISAILTLYALVVVAVAAILALALPVIIDQTIQLIQFIPNLIEKLKLAIDEHSPRLMEFVNSYFTPEELKEMSKPFMDGLKNMTKQSLPALKEFGRVMGNIIAIGTALAIIPIYLFFFLKSDHNPLKDVKDNLSFIPPHIRDDIVFLLREFVNIIVSFFRGQFLIGLIMGVLLALGFSVSGLQFGIVLGLSAGFLNIIPYLGTIIGLACVIPTALFQQDGGMLTLGLCLGVFAIVQVIEGYFLTPKIMGDRTGLHPLAIIIAIFFWGTALSGILGMILAIPLTAFFITAWRLIKKKYLDNDRTTTHELPEESV